MVSGVEVVFNLLWFGLLAAGTVITIVILKKRDPFDDGPALDEEAETPPVDRQD